MTGYEPILFDSNILVYAHNLYSPFYKRAKELHEQVVFKNLKGAVAIQNLLEFYATITSPKLVGNRQAPKNAHRSCIVYLNAGFKIIYPKQDDLRNALYLAEKKNISGKKIFDIYLVATMLSNGINTVYTANDKDFKDFSEIKAINPFY